MYGRASQQIVFQIRMAKDVLIPEPSLHRNKVWRGTEKAAPFALCLDSIPVRLYQWNLNCRRLSALFDGILPRSRSGASGSVHLCTVQPNDVS
jgi:hypothetical protein